MRSVSLSIRYAFSAFESLCERNPTEISQRPRDDCALAVLIRHHRRLGTRLLVLFFSPRSSRKNASAFTSYCARFMQRRFDRRRQRANPPILIYHLFAASTFHITFCSAESGLHFVPTKSAISRRGRVKLSSGTLLSSLPAHDRNSRSVRARRTRLFSRISGANRVPRRLNRRRMLSLDTVGFHRSARRFIVVDKLICGLSLCDLCNFLFFPILGFYVPNPICYAVRTAKFSYL